MRGKNAKRLRKLANDMSTGMKKVQYQEKAVNPRKPTHRTRFLYECTRLIYKNIKRAVRSEAQE